MRWIVAIALACVACGCGRGNDPAPAPLRQPKGHTAERPNAQPAGAAAQARAVAQAYLDALAGGDGEAACRLLSPGVISDTGDFRTRAACVRDLSRVRSLGRFPIFKVEMRSPTRAVVWIDARPYSDTGYDNLPLKRYGDRWLLEGT
jgi:hypothetical protein